MKQEAPRNATNRTEPAEQTTTRPVQPTLPGIATVHPRFRIPERTRRIGLAGVAAARAQLAEQAARREAREAERTGRKQAQAPGQRRAA